MEVFHWPSLCRNTMLFLMKRRSGSLLRSHRIFAFTTTSRGVTNAVSASLPVLQPASMISAAQNHAGGGPRRCRAGLPADERGCLELLAVLLVRPLPARQFSRRPHHHPA